MTSHFDSNSDQHASARVAFSRGDADDDDDRCHAGATEKPGADAPSQDIQRRVFIRAGV